jgi:hypothetical protein
MAIKQFYEIFNQIVKRGITMNVMLTYCSKKKSNVDIFIWWLFMALFLHFFKTLQNITLLENAKNSLFFSFKLTNKILKFWVDMFLMLLKLARICWSNCIYQFHLNSLFTFLFLVHNTFLLFEILIL